MSGPPFVITGVCRGGGYRYARTEPPHPHANSSGLYPLHRVLLENKIGRLLSSKEHVHHVDLDKTNDSPDNLEVKTPSDHGRFHHPTSVPADIVCAFCARTFQIPPHIYRRRLAQSNNGRLYCSRSCASYSTSPTHRGRGYCLDKRTGKWKVAVQVSGKRHNLGYFTAECDAVNAVTDFLAAHEDRVVA